MLNKHEDHRGLFAELYKESHVALAQFKPKQVSYLTINKGCFRGSHFHKDNLEAFILLDGDCEISCIWSQENEQFDNLFSGQTKQLKLFEIYTVFPKVQHTLFSKNGAKILILSSKEFDPQNPDVYNLYDNSK